VSKLPVKAIRVCVIKASSPSLSATRPGSLFNAILAGLHPLAAKNLIVDFPDVLTFGGSSLIVSETFHRMVHWLF
jgi:hypothetical protein